MEENNYKIPLCKNCWYKRLIKCMGIEYKRIDFEKNTCKHWRDEDIELVSRCKEFLDNQTRRDNKRSYHAKVNSFIHGYGWEE